MRLVVCWAGASPSATGGVRGGRRGSRDAARAGAHGGRIAAPGPAGDGAGARRPGAGLELDSAWNLSPAVLVPASLALALFFQGFVRLRRRGRRDHAPWWRAVVVRGSGCGLAVLALVSPLDAIGEEYLLSVHMLQHVVIGDVAAALMLLALSGPLLFFFLPARRSRTARARPPGAGAGRAPLATGRRVRYLGSVVRRLARARALRRGAHARWVHDLEHVTLRDRRLPRLVPAPRPGPAGGT